MRSPRRSRRRSPRPAHPDAKVRFIQAVRTADARPFAAELDALAQNASRAREATGEFSQAAANLRESIGGLRAIVGGAASELT